MASMLDFASTVSFVLLLVKLSIFANNPACATSRLLAQDRHHHKLHDVGFRAMLQRVDSGKNLTKFERIQHGIKRGLHRLQKLNAMVLDASATAATTAHASQISSPVLAGNGEFLMQLSIGTPPEAYSAIIDTGSDLIWTQCKPCTRCYSQPTPIFDPEKSSSFSKLSCLSELCKALPQPTCKNGCEYSYSYGDYSSTEGILASETFKFGDTSVSNVGFGCGDDNVGDGFTQAAGLVGLGRGQLSLVSQLKEPKFSYCLTSIDDTQTDSLLMGSLATLNSSKNRVKTTPLITNPSQQSFYYLSLEGITVGGIKLPIDKSTFALQDDGSGGLIIDSGTTISYLEESAFDLVKEEFTNQIDLPVDQSGSTGLELCFILPKGVDELKVPKLIFHFDGADLDLPGENYMIADSSSGVLCLAMGSSNGLSIFGNIQQQNLLVHHDLEKQTLSFVPTRCDQF